MIPSEKSLIITLFFRWPNHFVITPSLFFPPNSPILQPPFLHPRLPKRHNPKNLLIGSLRLNQSNNSVLPYSLLFSFSSFSPKYFAAPFYPSSVLPCSTLRAGVDHHRRTLLVQSSNSLWRDWTCNPGPWGMENKYDRPPKKTQIMITGTRPHGTKRRLLPESGNKSYVKNNLSTDKKTQLLCPSCGSWGSMNYLSRAFVTSYSSCMTLQAADRKDSAIWSRGLVFSILSFHIV